MPASIAGDAVIILSNNWNDAQSFIHPFSSNNRVASDTVVRFAMLAGDAITGDRSAYSPSQFGQLNGGVHNFKRFLETWTDKRLNYSGSLINLFNSQNNNGFLKCCATVYSPPCAIGRSTALFRASIACCPERLLSTQSHLQDSSASTIKSRYLQKKRARGLFR